jgi:protein TonB
LVSVVLHIAAMFAVQSGGPNVGGGSSSMPIVAVLERASAPAEEAPPATEPLPAPEGAKTEAPVEAVVPNQPGNEPAPPSPTTSAEVKEARPPLEMPVIRDPTYYAVRFLDEYPRPLGPVEPRYPERASRDDIGGKVTLLLLIDETGTLNEISVVEATPAEIFDEAALTAFRDMRFSPARKGGRAVRSRVLITVGFESGGKPASFK